MKNLSITSLRQMRLIRRVNMTQASLDAGYTMPNALHKIEEKFLDTQIRTIFRYANEGLQLGVSLIAEIETTEEIIEYHIEPTVSSNGKFDFMFRELFDLRGITVLQASEKLKCSKQAIWDFFSAQNPRISNISKYFHNILDAKFIIRFSDGYTNYNLEIK